MRVLDRRGPWWCGRCAPARICIRLNPLSAHARSIAVVDLDPPWLLRCMHMRIRNLASSSLATYAMPMGPYRRAQRGTCVRIAQIGRRRVANHDAICTGETTQHEFSGASECLTGAGRQTCMHSTHLVCRLVGLRVYVWIPMMVYDFYFSIIT